MHPLKAILEEGGVDLTGWTLTVVEDISEDGTTVVGSGSYSNGNNEAFVAVLPSPPGEIGVFGMSGSWVDGGSENFGNQGVGVGKTLPFTISNDAVGSATSLGSLSITTDGVDNSAFSVGALGATSLANGEGFYSIDI